MPLYIGLFSFRKQKISSEKKGEFQILSKAEDFEEALDEFRKKIEGIRHSSTLLSGKVRIGLDRVLELPLPPSQAVMLNFQYQDTASKQPLIVEPIPDHSEPVALYQGQKTPPFLDKTVDGFDTEFIVYTE